MVALKVTEVLVSEFPAASMLVAVELTKWSVAASLSSQEAVPGSYRMQ